MNKWRLAESLEKLRDEVNVLYPNRSKASDGTRGDAAHAKRKSDHNLNAQGVVCALDLTHDPKNDADMYAIAEYIITHRHPALAYVIFRRSFASQLSGWKWRQYTGSNPHIKHMHVSVVQDEARYDIEGVWLKDFKHEEKPMTKLLVNDKPFETFDIYDSGSIYVSVKELVKAINDVTGVKASLLWNEKTKTAKLYVRSEK